MYQIFNIILYVLFFLKINLAVVYANYSYLKYPTTKKLYINSDNLVINHTKNCACFTGAVLLYFDNLMIKTTILKIFYKTTNGTKTIHRISIPSKLVAMRSYGQDLLVADSAKYFADTRQLTLLGSVIIQNKDSIIKTDKLLYYTKLNIIDYHSIKN